MRNSSQSSPQKKSYQTTSEKIVKLIRTEFTDLNNPDEASESSLELLRQLTARLSSELGISLANSYEDISNQELLSFSLLLLSDAQSSIIKGKPNLSKSNQYAISNFAQAFGVAEEPDSKSLLQSIAKRYGISDYENIGEEIKNRLLCMPRLISKFNLDKHNPSLLFNPDNLYNLIIEKCETSSFLDRLINFLDLPVNSDEESVFRYLKEKLQIEDQADTIVILKRQNRELKEKLSEMKSASKPEIKVESPAKIFNPEKELFDRKLAICQVKINTLESENEELKSKIDQLKNGPNIFTNEIQNLKQTNSFFEEQFNKQIEELQNGSDNRMDMIRIIQKQSQLLTEYDKALSERERSRDIKGNYTRRHVIAPAIDEQMYNFMCEAIENAPSDIVDQILKILNNENYTNPEKVKKSIEYFIARIRKQQKMIKSNVGNDSYQRLLNAFHSQLHFLENLVSFDDDVQFLFSDPDEAKQSLLHQAEQIKKFLDNEGKGFAEDANIFDSMALNVDPMKMDEQLQAFFDHYTEIKTIEGQELFVLLRQAFAVNSILRRFSLTSRNQVEKLSSYIRVMSSESKKLQELKNQTVTSLNDQLDTEYQERAKVEQELKKLKSVIKANEAVIENQESIQNELDQTRIKLDQSTRELQQVKKSLSLVDDSQVKLLNKEIENLNAKLKTVKDQNDKLKRELRGQKDENERKCTNLKEKIALLQQTIDIQSKEINDFQNERRKTDNLKQKYNKLQLKRQDDADTLSELNEKIKQLESEKDRLSNENQAQNENIQQLQNQFRQSKSVLMAKEFDEKLHQQKLSSIQKEMEKEREKYDAIISLQKTATLGEINLSIEKTREECKKQIINFMTKICNSMSPYYDFSKPITEDNILKSIQLMKVSLQQIQQQNVEFKLQLSQIRSAYGLQKHIDLVEFTKETIQKIDEMSQQTKQLQKQITALENGPAVKNNTAAREWEEWARSLYVTIAENPSAVTTTSAVKQGIEDAIEHSSGNSRTQRKLECLRLEKKLLMRYSTRNEILTQPQLTETDLDSIRPLIVQIGAIHRMRLYSGRELNEEQKETQYQKLLDQHDYLTQEDPITPKSPNLSSKKSFDTPHKPKKESKYSKNTFDVDENDYIPVPIFSNISDQ